MANCLDNCGGKCGFDCANCGANKSDDGVIMAKKYQLKATVVDSVALEPVSEAVEAPVAAFVPSAGVNTYTAVDGDSYASIAAKFKLDTETKHDYAKRLFALNGGKSISAGVGVKL